MAVDMNCSNTTTKILRPWIQPNMPTKVKVKVQTLLALALLDISRDQKRCTNNLTYRERLVVTKLDSLELRRLRVDLIMCYNIVFRLINVDFCAFFRFAPYCNTRGHGYKLFAEQCTHNVRYYSFARRVVGPWNRLPAHVDFCLLYTSPSPRD